MFWSFWVQFLRRPQDLNVLFDDQDATDDWAAYNCPLHLYLLVVYLLSDPIPLPKRWIVIRPVFEQMNIYIKADYVTVYILSEKQKHLQLPFLNSGVTGSKFT